MDIRQQKQYKILVVGDACSDVYVFGACSRLSPEAPVPIFVKTREETRRGMSENVSNNLKSFNCEVTLHHNTNDIIKKRIVDEKFNQHLIRIDEESNVDRIDTSGFNSDYIRKFDAIIISDYNKGFLFDEDIRLLTSLAKSCNIPMFADTKRKNLSSFIGTVLKLNKSESISSYGITECSTAIVTLGKDGAMWNEIIFSIEESEVHDVCGAGDVFLSALVFMYLESNKNMAKSINFANLCASISVSHFGTYCLSKGDIDDLCF